MIMPHSLRIPLPAFPEMAYGFRRIYHLMMNAKEAKSEGYSAEAYASDNAIPLTAPPYEYCGCNLFAAYELCTRLWHLWDKYNAPTDCD